MDQAELPLTRLLILETRTAPAASKWFDSVTIASSCRGVLEIVLLLDHRALVPKVFWNYNLVQYRTQYTIGLSCTKITVRGGLCLVCKLK